MTEQRKTLPFLMGTSSEFLSGHCGKLGFELMLPSRPGILKRNLIPWRTIPGERDSVSSGLRAKRAR